MIFSFNEKMRQNASTKGRVNDFIAKIVLGPELILVDSEVENY